MPLPVIWASPGTPSPFYATNPYVRCDRAREAASARLDGEPLGTSTTALDQHLAGCPDCARWVAEATRLTRLARLGPAHAPDLADAITSDVVLPTRRVLRRRLTLRLLLVAAGIAQLAIAVPALVGDSIGMAMSEHGAHEAAAWNLALAAAFVAAAVAPRRAAGLVPLLGTFIVVLGALCVHDLAAGAVSPDRVLTHLVAVIGLVLLLVLDRNERALPPGRFTATPKDEPKKLRGVA
jgi:predicted anti-sigma-YlaC factor YlaD